ncbi:MAG: SO_0444 family Cu/Zn efflux transporter [Planctomycetota bacterium]
MPDLFTRLGPEFWTTLTQMAPYLLFGFLAAGLLSVFVSARWVERHLGGRARWPIPKAALFGIPLPLCSCSVLPVTASLRKHGATHGSTIAFLISTPQTGVDSILVTFALLGPVFAVVRPVVALLSGLVGGVVAHELAGPGDGDTVNPEPCRDACCNHDGRGGRLKRALAYGFGELPGDIGVALLIGIAVAGLIAAVVPKGYFVDVGSGLGSILVMMLLGIPVYVCSTASVPIAAALILKGVSPGAALAFLMTGPATNAAGVATVWRLLGTRTALAYLGTVAATAVGSGLALNALIGGSEVVTEHVGHAMLPGSVRAASALLLLVVLAVALFRRARESHAPSHRHAEEPGACCHQ